jgi:hypothetical protein
VPNCDLLSFLIKLDIALSEWMVDDLAGLVMLDTDHQLGTGAMAAPFGAPGDEADFIAESWHISSIAFL